MSRLKWTAWIPYLLLLAVAGVLYGLANDIIFSARANQIGPSAWPKFAIGLLALACIYEIGRTFGRGADVPPVTDEQGGISAEIEGPRYPWLLAGGIALTFTYALIVTTIGFFLATFLYVVAFMYLGRFRNHVAIWLTATGLTFIMGLLLLRVVYVSLPRGMPPFDRIADFVRISAGG